MNWKTCALLLVSAGSLQAQGAASPRVDRTSDSSAQAAKQTIIIRDSAKQLAVRGDTAGAAKLLKDATERMSHDAELWHQYGMLLQAWTRAWAGGKGKVAPAGVPQRMIAAESSLARAVALAPDSATYALDYARHLVTSSIWSAWHGEDVARGAVATAEKAGDTARTVETADRVGLMLWGMYENANDDFVEGGDALGRKIVPKSRLDTIVRAIRGVHWQDHGHLNDALYLDALEYFRYARSNSPKAELPFRHEMMVLAQRWRWQEIDAISRERIKQDRSQAWPWLTLGLSLQRRDKYIEAAAMFDSGFVRMPRAEQDGLRSLSRLFTPDRTAWFKALEPKTQEQVASLYWSEVDPSLLMRGNPAISEFDARLVYAELMWSDSDRKINGAETLRGMAHVRWGPPDVRAPRMWYFDFENFNFPVAPEPGPYAKPDVVQAFGRRKQAVVGTLPLWSNIDVVRRGIESIELEVSRFRVLDDTGSMELLINSEVPVGAVRAASPLEASTIRRALFTIDAYGGIVASRVDSIVVKGDNPYAMQRRLQRLRASSHLMEVRMEALETAAEKLARGLYTVHGFTTSGFGLSDLVIGTNVTPPANLATSRWFDFKIAPLESHAINGGEALDLLWENYDLTRRDNAANYRVSIRAELLDDTTSVSVAARVLSLLRGGSARSSSDGKFVYSYERTVPHQQAIVESMRFDLQSAKPGEYRVTVTVTDIPTGASQERSRNFYILPK